MRVEHHLEESAFSSHRHGAELPADPRYVQAREGTLYYDVD